MDRATPKEKASLPPSHSSNRLSQQLASAFSPPHSSGQLQLHVGRMRPPTAQVTCPFLHLHVWGATESTDSCMIYKQRLSSQGLRLTPQVNMPPCSCICAGDELLY